MYKICLLSIISAVFFQACSDKQIVQGIVIERRRQQDDSLSILYRYSFENKVYEKYYKVGSQWVVPDTISIEISAEAPDGGRVVNDKNPL